MSRDHGTGGEDSGHDHHGGCGGRARRDSHGHGPVDAGEKSTGADDHGDSREEGSSRRHDGDCGGGSAHRGRHAAGDCDGKRGRGRRRKRRGERLRGEDGTFAEAASPEEVMEAFDAVRGPVVTSSDVADLFNITPESARQKLSALYEAGLVDRRKSGRTVVYWRPGQK